MGFTARGGHWKKNREDRTFPFLALDVDCGPVVLNNLEADGQAEACALGFRRKKGIEDSLEMGFGNSTPRILHLNPYLSPPPSKKS